MSSLTEMDQSEVARMLGVSRSRIAQIEIAAMKKLRDSRLKQWLDSYEDSDEDYPRNKGTQLCPECGFTGGNHHPHCPNS
jgi:transcriptional regulator with XRE-family HTH domain